MLAREYYDIYLHDNGTRHFGFNSGCGRGGSRRRTGLVSQRFWSRYRAGSITEKTDGELVFFVEQCRNLRKNKISLRFLYSPKLPQGLKLSIRQNR